MGEARAETSISRPADAVWAVVGNFGDLSWVPGVESCEVDGDLRTFRIGGHELVERQLARDDARRRITYGLVGAEHEATVTVDPDGDASRLIWEVKTADERLDGTRETLEGVLAALKQQLEGEPRRHA